MTRRLSRPSRLALCFFVASSALLLISGTGTWLLVSTGTFTARSDRLIFPPAFLISTALLVFVSSRMHSACRWVRLERQKLFRSRLGQALLGATAFVTVQCYGLWCLLTVQRVTAEATGLTHSAFAFALLHGIHVLVALLFLVFVLLRALADRYDHEYSWGITFCTWFWHALGIVWLAIAGAFLIASAALPHS